MVVKAALQVQQPPTQVVVVVVVHQPVLVERVAEGRLPLTALTCQDKTASMGSAVEAARVAELLLA
jgi:hypothetical protein